MCLLDICWLFVFHFWKEIYDLWVFFWRTMRSLNSVLQFWKETEVCPCLGAFIQMLVNRQSLESTQEKLQRALQKLLLLGNQFSLFIFKPVRVFYIWLQRETRRWEQEEILVCFKCFTCSPPFSQHVDSNQLMLFGEIQQNIWINDVRGWAALKLTCVCIIWSLIFGCLIFVNNRRL